MSIPILVSANAFAADLDQLNRCTASQQKLLANYTAAQANKMLQQLLELDNQCQTSQSYEHNLGVVASDLGYWDQALAHFEEALKKDPSAYQIHGNLKRVHRYKAALAYRTALLSDSPEPKLPELTFLLPSPTTRKVDSTLNSLLNQWWQAIDSDLQCECYIKSAIKDPLIKQYIRGISINNLLPQYQSVELSEQSKLAIFTTDLHRTVVLHLRQQSPKNWLIESETLLP